MSRIKDIPTNRKDYYERCQAAYKLKYMRCSKAMEGLKARLNEVYEDVCMSKDYYKEHNNINLDDYIEFVNNEFIDGSFYKLARRLYLNTKNKHEVIIEYYDLVTLAKQQRAVYNLQKEITLCERVLSLGYKQYTKIVKDFYYAVHKELILNGNAYKFDYGIGYLVINRCKNTNRYSTMIDFAATTAKKKEILARGGRLYDEEEAKYCKLCGIKYDGEDYKVYKHDEYYYEIDLLYPRIKGEYRLSFSSSDYRHYSFRGKTLDDLIAMCDRDKEKICSLEIDIRAKLTMCLKVDDLLYTKYIRNETQATYKYKPFDR